MAVMSLTWTVPNVLPKPFNRCLFFFRPRFTHVGCFHRCYADCHCRKKNSWQTRESLLSFVAHMFILSLRLHCSMYLMGYRTGGTKNWRGTKTVKSIATAEWPCVIRSWCNTRQRMETRKALVARKNLIVTWRTALFHSFQVNGIDGGTTSAILADRHRLV